MELDSRIVDWFCGIHNNVITRSGVVVYSQLFLSEFNNLTFRATPDYLGTGPWYDWVLVSYVDSNEMSVNYPFKILGFVEKDDKSGPICFGKMRGMQTQREKFDSSVGLFKHWHLERQPHSDQPVYRFVAIDSIIDPCRTFQFTTLALNRLGSSTELTKHVLVVKGRQQEWPSIFLNGIRK